MRMYVVLLTGKYLAVNLQVLIPVIAQPVTYLPVLKL